MTIGKRGM